MHESSGVLQAASHLKPLREPAAGKKKDLTPTCPEDRGAYDVSSLSMFYENCGWVPVVRDGGYAAPLAGLWDEE